VTEENAPLLDGDPSGTRPNQSGGGVPLTVFISYHREDSEDYADFIPLLAKNLQSTLRNRTPAHVILDIKQYPLSSDFQADVASDLLKQPIFLPIITPGWVDSDNCHKEYRAFLAGYELDEQAEEEECAQTANRVRVLVLHAEAVKDLQKYFPDEHSIKTLFRGSVGSDQYVPDRSIVRMAKRKKGSDEWDDWIKKLASDLIKIHRDKPPNPPELQSHNGYPTSDDLIDAVPKTELEPGQLPPSPKDVSPAAPPLSTLSDAIQDRCSALNLNSASLPDWLGELDIAPETWTGSDSQTLLLDLLLTRSHHDATQPKRWFEGVLRDMGATDTNVRKAAKSAK
jgi:hypothetical protein